MDDISSDTATATETPAFDLNATADRISNDIFPSHEEPVETEEAAPVAEQPVVEQPVTEPTPIVRQVPKTWPKEMHEHWGKTDPKVQEYLETREKQMLDGLSSYKEAATFGKSLHDVVSPYMADIQAAKTDIPTAVNYLLNANRRLTTGTQESRLAAYQELGRSLGLNAAPNGEAPAPVDPNVKALQDQFSQLQQTLTQREQADLQVARERVSKEVEVFASDPAHAYFEEVSGDIVTLLQTGLPLQEAYEKAVWANPVTRAKEIARVQTEHEVKLKENARLSSLPKKKALGVNVRSRETDKAPTGPTGTFEDIARETLREQRSRV